MNHERMLDEELGRLVMAEARPGSENLLGPKGTTPENLDEWQRVKRGKFRPELEKENDLEDIDMAIMALDKAQKIAFQKAEIVAGKGSEDYSLASALIGTRDDLKYARRDVEKGKKSPWWKTQERNDWPFIKQLQNAYKKASLDAQKNAEWGLKWSERVLDTLRELKTVLKESVNEGIGGDVEAVRGDAVFKAFQQQVNAGRKQGDLERSRKDPDGIDDLVDWFNENAAAEIHAAIQSLKVLEHYAGTGILGADNRTRRAAADLTAELNAVFYRIGQLAGLQQKKA